MKFYLKTISIVLSFLIFTNTVFAQCAMCTKTAAGLDNKSALGLNKAIVFLALIPLGIMFTIGFIWWKSNKSQSN